MANNPYVNKVQYGNQTIMDLTDDDVTSQDVLSGKKFHDRSGAQQTGSLVTHQIAPTPSENLTEQQIVTVVNASQGTNENPPSLFGLKNWSNCDAITLYTTATRGTDTIGDWEDDDEWKESGASRSGWLWHSVLAGVITDDEVEIKEIFDVRNEEIVGLNSCRLDDEIYMAVSSPSGNPQSQGWYELSGTTYVLTSDTTVQAGKTYYCIGGAIAIKLNNPIKSQNIKLGIKLVRQRTKVMYFTVLS